ncbi:MAG: nucleotide exchange factor GrpE [bacterium]
MKKKKMSEIKAERAEELPSEEKTPPKEELETVSVKELEELKTKAHLADDYLDHLKRLKAEFENFKKRMIREKEQFLKLANEGLILELLPVMDNFERAINHGEDNSEGLLEGMKLIKKQWDDVLAKRGLSRMEVVGQKFDPTKHEAMLHMESEEHPEEHITEELISGYQLNDKVLRPAKVVVSKGAKE